MSATVSPESSEGARSAPLVVDLHTALLRADPTAESAIALVKRSPLSPFRLLARFVRDRKGLRRWISRSAPTDVDTLLYRESVVRFLHAERDRGRRLILATPHDRAHALEIAAHLELFDDVMCTGDASDRENRSTLDEARRLCGSDEFDHLGEPDADDALRHGATRALSVMDIDPAEADRSGHRESARAWFRALRPHQWLKNALLFIPLGMAHRLGDVGALAQVSLAFVAFGLCASSVYVQNDLLDLVDDRRHPTKRRRPFASGALSVTAGMAAVPLLAVIAFALAIVLSPRFAAVLAVYYAITMAYSWRLKRAALIDVITLAMLYTLRIIAGGAAVDIEPSFWLLSFAMFVFLSLAMAKRYTELETMSRLQRAPPSGRGYRAGDLDTLSQFGSASACVAVLVLALYIDSDSVRELYRVPELIWLLCPLLLYLIMRIWLLARRGELDEDPVVFVLKDPRSLVLGAAGAVLLRLAV